MNTVVVTEDNKTILVDTGEKIAVSEDVIKIISAGQTISVPIPIEIRLINGLAYALTANMAVSDNTGISLNEVSVFIAYV